jgi:hypothetical protein
VVTVIVGVITLVVTFREQEQHANDTLTATKIELEAPYQKKKLALYLDAARVLAHLAAAPNVDKEKMEARFWELYWGELAFVESQTKNLNGDTPPSVEELMVRFCHAYFQDDQRRCSSAASGASGTEKQSLTPT